MKSVSAPRRRGAKGAAVALFLLLLSFPAAPALSARPDGAPRGTRSYEERAVAEKTTRSRYRRLEVASLVLIFAGAGAAILWAVRRR